MQPVQALVIRVELIHHAWRQHERRRRCAPSLSRNPRWISPRLRAAQSEAASRRPSFDLAYSSVHRSGPPMGAHSVHIRRVGRADQLIK
jgi:hypothetical protein